MMKPLTIFFIAALMAGIYSCNSSERKSNGNDSVAGTSAATEDIQCYLAIDRNDTAHLSIQTISGDKVQGDLVISYAKSPAHKGTLTGKFSGDTLFADYTFTTGEKKEVSRNPLAFLKEGNRLILGVGTIETYLGRSYLAKDKPIEFDKGRFKFDATDCE
jgi:hypothetical protein